MFPKQMDSLARKILQKPLEITVGRRSVVAAEIEQIVEVRPEESKFNRLLDILGQMYNEDPECRTLIFVDRQEAADNLLRDLMRKGYLCMSLHGGKDQAINAAVPSELEELANGFLEKVESGKAQVAGSGFGGKGHRRQIPSNVMGNADFPGVRHDHTTQVPQVYITPSATSSTARWSLKTVYPPAEVEDASEITIRLSSRYPWLDIYPSVYPFVEPYPTLNKTCESPMSISQTHYKSECVKVTLARYYPSFDLYPAAYPHFDLYPTLPKIGSRGSQQEASAKDIVDSVSVDLAGTYPYICPYPPAYPHFDLYPRVQTHASRDDTDLTTSKFIATSSTYPFLVIYPAVYPHFDLYPARAAELASREEDITNNKLFISSSTYPLLVIYPAVYPHFDLYPARAAELTSREEDMTNGKFSVPVYPFLVVYPAVYPHFDLYPARAAELASGEVDITNSKPSVSSSTYPFLVIYPRVYPHFNLYPTRAAELVTREESNILHHEETKARLAWDDPKANHGYVQVGRERVTTSMDAAEIAVLRAKAPDTKESMEIRRENHPTFSNKWPQETEVPRFKQTMLHFFQTFHEVHTMVMKSIALGLDLPEDFFDNKIDRDGQARAASHTGETLTLLFQDSIGGLEVQNPHTKHYQPASPIPGTIVVNAGDLLARWSNDVLRSTLHRVVAPPATKINATEGMTPARQSIAFFCNPNFDAIIESLPTCTSTSNPSRYPPLTTEQYIVGRLATTYS
ncbi:hypothetical protein EV424DRAFT_1539010 [Suillus variegatus]|nr:hypothetical protein EV424DRAFT_1539010 [Suillus variegatus]